MGGVKEIKIHSTLWTTPNIYEIQIWWFLFNNQ